MNNYFFLIKVLFLCQYKKQKMSILVKNTTKLYGNQLALNNVSFEILSGEIVGFLGPNGAGKSTMMKIITTYLPKSDGIVIVNGFDVDSSPWEVKKSVGYLPEYKRVFKISCRYSFCF